MREFKFESKVSCEKFLTHLKVDTFVPYKESVWQNIKDEHKYYVVYVKDKTCMKATLFGEKARSERVHYHFYELEQDSKDDEEQLELVKTVLRLKQAYQQIKKGGR